MTELTHVISSTGLDDESNVAVEDACPRQLLGLTCIVEQYACLCEQVDACSIDTVRNESGETAIINLNMTLTQGVGKASTVLGLLDLTGYKADIQASQQALRASFNLRRPQNVPLRLFVVERGL